MKIVYLNCTNQKEEHSKRVEEQLEFKVYLKSSVEGGAFKDGFISMRNYFTRSVFAIVTKQKQVQQY